MPRRTRDGRAWTVGTGADVAWLQGLPLGTTIGSAVPLVFEDYATLLPPAGVGEAEHERAVVDVLLRHAPPQRWWLGYLDTGAHDVVLPDAPRVRLYADWPYVLVLAGVEQALTWRTGHLRGGLQGALPDLVFPVDRSWLLTGLWDDTWLSLGGSTALVEALLREPRAGARRVRPDEDCAPPGVVRP